MFYLHKDLSKSYLVIFYRNFQLKPVSGKGSAPHCHIGLGVNAMHTAKVLRDQKIRTDVFGVWLPIDIHNHLDKLGKEVSHVIIEAPWILTREMEELIFKYPYIHFIVRSHSQVGFLQVEAGAVQLIREYATLQDSSLNFTLAANSQRFCEFMECTYKSKCVYLPNLYYHDRVPANDYRVHQSGQPLKVSSFGAIRLLKNHSTAAAGALMLARMRNSDLEFYMTVNREEHGNGVLQAIRNLFKDLPWAKLVEIPWQPWGTFIQIVENMHISFQVSCTETFNICIADSCARNVPVVVSNVIEWIPKHYHADLDDAKDIARVANNALNHPKAGLECNNALKTTMEHSIKCWKNYLSN